MLDDMNPSMVDHLMCLGSSIPSTASAKPSDSVENVPFSTTGVFPPITHSRERNPITVCLASLVFLVVSAVIATVFSTLILPLCLLAALIRRIGLCWANFCWFPSTTLCCRCCRPQRRLINSNNLFHLFIARLYPIPNGDDTEANMTWCRCEPISNPIGPAQTYYALSAAELRWLPPVPTLSIPSSLQQTLRSPYPSKSQYLNCSSLENSMPLYCAENPPLILICLRFGAPGVQLTKLREVIATRLFPFQSTPSSLASSTHESCLSDKFNLGGPGTSESHPRANSLTPPGDALVRLTQCLTCLSTGYAWQPCNAFRIDEHVLPVPATCLSEASDKTTRFVHFTTSDSLRDGCPVPVRVESVVSAISQLPFLIHRPLWQVYLLEKFQDVSHRVSKCR
ncbi:hypothetical protein D915_008537 [Fasciola hepatica]|uniref:Uncharacterized protein n=1 Tax=Fasciola hepatica TaxID=6192 RepID=A0A4E0R066_FASHE|nr:hypothetical protein D915_008537 [Fasciola hepatica]